MSGYGWLQPPVYSRFFSRARGISQNHRREDLGFCISTSVIPANVSGPQLIECLKSQIKARKSQTAFLRWWITKLRMIRQGFQNPAFPIPVIFLKILPIALLQMPVSFGIRRKTMIFKPMVLLFTSIGTSFLLTLVAY